MSYLINYFKNNNPHIRDEEIERIVEISDYDLFIEYKNGSRVMYDMFKNSFRGVPYIEGEITEEQYKKEFSIRLQQFMDRNFITQDILAEQVGTSQAMISRYVRGLALPSFVMSVKLAKVLNCKVDDFYYKEY